MPINNAKHNGEFKPFSQRVKKKSGKYLVESKQIPYLCTRKSETVPWMSGLVSGLQNRVRRFESARDLLKIKPGTLDEWLSQRSAKPRTAVRIRQVPP